MDTGYVLSRLFICNMILIVILLIMCVCIYLRNMSANCYFLCLLGTQRSGCVLLILVFVGVGDWKRGAISDSIILQDPASGSWDSWPPAGLLQPARVPANSQLA